MTMGPQQTEPLYVYIYIVQVGGIVDDELHFYNTYIPTRKTDKQHALTRTTSL